MVILQMIFEGFLLGQLGQTSVDPRSGYIKQNLTYHEVWYWLSGFNIFSTPSNKYDIWNTCILTVKEL